MIEISKLVTGAKINASTPPVEPTRASSRTEGESGTATSEGVAPQNGDTSGAQQTASASVAQPTVAESKPTQEMIAAAMDKANAKLNDLDTSLSFTMNKTLGRVIVRLVQNDTGEVILQFPPEDIVKMSERLDKAVKQMSGDKEAILGLLIDRKH